LHWRGNEGSAFMKIEVFEITSKEDKIYQELLEQYKTNLELQGLLNKFIIPEELVMMGDFRLITMINRVIDWDIMKVYLVKDVDNDTFVWVIGKSEDKEGINMYPLLKEQSKELQLAIRKALIEKGLMKELNAKQLCSGIFWILSDNDDLSEFILLKFDIPCDSNGVPKNTHSVELNSKSGNSYNHKKIWGSEIKNKSAPYRNKKYNYYPRGRVEISNNKAVIYLNPHINKPVFIDAIKKEFGLSDCNISEVRVKVDGSKHYKCFLDWK
jgi:hypothetical protein